MKDSNSMMNKNVQAVLSKLISEEWIAGNLYSLMTISCKKDEREIITNLFTDLYVDEMHDHYKSLIEWCQRYDYDVPCDIDEYKKLAEKKLVKIFTSFKKNQDAKYYIQQAIESEKLAIESYQEILDMEEIPAFTDLQATLWQIFFEEREHLSKLETALIACDANVELLI